MTYDGSSSTPNPQQPQPQYQQPQYGQQAQGYQAQYYPFGGPEPQNSPDPRGPQRPSRFKSHLRFYWQDGGPVITAAITVICVAVWLLELYGYYLNPAFYARMLSNGAFIPALASHRPWMFVSSMFLHATNVTHVLFNMLTLWAVGPVLERMLGHWRYLALYMLSGIGGSVGMLVAAVIQPQGWMVSAVGASGAIFGLFGAVLVVYKRSGTDIRSMLVFVGINLAMPFFVSGIAWQDHVGGFVTGGLLTLMLISGLGFLRGKTLTARMWISGLVIGVILLVLAIFCFGQNPLSGVNLPF
ncbi:rhomboid family intramembrane serine protease [Bombiscardovia apis]|uniref:Rhomboid family intramembrane serine protease n=1 Tax=Bombiscardovia apis TaxID=2932182 RepID=A0ABN6SCW9_9BIFI|nr:rhomboid family intramembrane serine protease [Bombiscardovia apis]BDR53936.1 rhomboid family intramembrane serine protease [Bombiscardovia apis]